jgi:predicted AAA+ superfamily ATPase
MEWHSIFNGKSMYQRTLANTVKQASETFPVVMITGPRQVGKTTLFELCAENNRNYVSLDDLEARTMAQDDPGLFVQTYPPPIIIDEIQYAPALFSHIKVIVDQKKQNGLYWLTGSQKFHLMKGITESLAGRVALIHLLGLSQAEIAGRQHTLPFIPTTQWVQAASKSVRQPMTMMQLFDRIWKGSFPKLYQEKNTSRDLFYQSYLATYVQRDVKDILAISNEIIFLRFLRAIAARTSQLLNYADMARDVGIDQKTAKAWLSVLQTAGLVYLLQPYYSNVTKRLVKTPKLYFLDTGLCTYLTKWPTAQTLEAGSMSGPLLETYVFNEILKSYWHQGIEPNFYYYRDTDQHEVDLIIEVGDTIYPVEIKKTATPSRTASKNFKVLAKLGATIGHGTVLCLVPEHTPLSRQVTAVPIGYL